MADQNTAQDHERFVNIGATLVADPQPSVLMQPTDCAFHDPTKDPQTAAVFGIAPRDQRHDATLGEFLPMRVGIIRPIRQEFSRPLHGASNLAGNRWDGIYQRDQLGDIVAVAPCQRRGQRNAVGIGDEVMLGAALAAIYRAGTSIFGSSSLLQMGCGW